MNAARLAARDAYAHRVLVSRVIQRRVVQAMPEQRRAIAVEQFEQVIKQLDQPASPDALEAAAAVLAVDPQARQPELPLR